MCRQPADCRHVGRDGAADAHWQLRPGLRVRHASLRLIVGGDVQPINLDLIPNFGDDIVEGMKGQISTTRSTTSRTVCRSAAEPTSCSGTKT